MKGRALLCAAGIALVVASPPAARWATAAGKTAAADKTDIDKMVAAAKTAKEQEAIAAYYDKQAAEARAKMADLKKLLDAYKKKGGVYVERSHFDQNCEVLTNMYESIASNYTAMAQAHRELAKEAK